MRPSLQPTTRWLAIVFAVPVMLLCGWAVLVFGDYRSTLAEQEHRAGDELIDRAIARIDDGLLKRAAPSDPAPMTLGREGVPTGPFLVVSPDIQRLPASRPTRHLVVDLATRFEAGRRPDAAIGLFERARRENLPLDARARLSEIRALVAANRTDDALARLDEAPADALAPVSGELGAAALLALLRLNVLVAAGRTEPAAAIAADLASARTPMGASCADAVVDEIRAAAVLEDASLVDLLPVKARTFTALREGTLAVPTNPTRTGDAVIVPCPSGLAVVSAQAAELCAHTTLAALSAETMRDVRLGAVAGADVTRPVERLGLSLSVSTPGGRASARVGSIANLLLFLAGLSSAIGGVFAVRMARRELTLSKLKQDFVDVVSHELRTPLTALSLKTEMLAHGDVPKDRVDDYARGMHGEVRRLGELVNRLLDFARLEKGRATIEKQRLETRAFLARVIWDLRPVVRAAGQRLTIDARRELPAFEGDPELLGRALRNLVENAGKYAPRASVVDLSASNGNGRITFVVADRGPGVAPADLPGLFEPFRRGVNSASVPGSGLGLFLVQQAARLHGGDARARNRSGGGAEFSIEIPVHDETR